MDNQLHGSAAVGNHHTDLDDTVGHTDDDHNLDLDSKPFHTNSGSQRTLGFHRAQSEFPFHSSTSAYTQDHIPAM